MKTNYFRGTLVALRAVEPEDLEVLYTMENDPGTWDVSNFSVPYSHYDLRQYIANSQSDIFADRQLRLMIVRQTDGAVVGTIDLTDYQPMHGRGEVGIAIQTSYQGNGYAHEALILLMDYLFGFLHLHQLTAHVLEQNDASLRLFEKCGFVRCGMLPEWWRTDNGYCDVVVLQKLNKK